MCVCVCVSNGVWFIEVPKSFCYFAQSVCVLFVFVCLFVCLPAAFAYLKSHPSGPVDRERLEQSCGIGVVITEEQIKQEVDQYNYLHVRACMYVCMCCS